ncbi:MAG TPA: hypothetical protein VLS49_02745, partial [Usitatibacter sp.]|nr:hypothetical protein [Usitatibacter sp.]
MMVRARPVRVHGAEGTEHSSPGAGTAGAPTLVLRAIGGSTPGLYEFRFERLAAGIPYRIGVKLLGASKARCPRIAWTVQRDPLVVAGDAPLSFRGYAVRSQLEVLASTEGRLAFRKAYTSLWVGADTLDFRDPSKAVRTLRWRSDLPGVTGGELQVSVRPFPRIRQRAYDPCTGASAGVILHRSFDAVAGEWNTLPPVDFGALALGSRGDVALPDGSTGVDARTLTKLDAGMPLYVRVIPRIGNTLLCDPDRGGVPPEVQLAQLLPGLFGGSPSPNPELHLGTVWYTRPLISVHPVPGETCYRVTKPHAILSQTLFQSPWDVAASIGTQTPVGGTINPGPNARFCIASDAGDDGWFDSVIDTFGSVLSAIVDGVGKLVNFTSNLWEEIQDAAVDAVASAVDEIGIVDCGAGSTCRAALETGLEVAMASMGVPPSLPNFDELVDQGFDYVAAQIASEAGIPDVVSDYASDQAQAFVKKAAKDLKASYGVPGLPDWLAADLRFDPAYLVVEVHGMGLAHPYDSRPRILRDNGPIYAGANLLLPLRLPGDGEAALRFPMVLPPNLEGLPPAPPGASEYDKARIDKKNWTQLRYTGGCYALRLTGLSDPGGVTPLFDVAFRAED